MTRDIEARREYHRQYRAKNKAKLAEYVRVWKQNNRDRVRAYAQPAYDPVKARAKGLRRKFGLTVAAFEAMRAAQDNKCAVCATATPGGRGTWHVDHDHATGKIRQLLCQNCNIGLGNFQDNPLLLEKAAKYLRKHKK